MNKPLALIVDDEPDILELLKITLARMDIDCVAAGNVTDAKRAIQMRNFFLCLTDMRLPDGDGYELVSFIQEIKPELPVAVITAFGNVEGAVNTLKAGAFDYVSKPVNLQMLRDLVNTALKLSNQSDGDGQGMGLLGKSAAMKQLRDTINKLARSQAPVYISGGSGSGKELVARMIHEQGPRKDKPFIPVNCGAIPSELMESEFFGHKKGSFTGATSDKAGLFQAAHGGTLFLDEIADLPIQMQVKLLRAIQEKAIRPVGGQKEVVVDVRILSATHKDLQQLVNEDLFRKDLFYRINVIEVKVPELSERPEDIPILAEHILQRLAGPSQTNLPELTTSSLDLLKTYSFPGNIRELENILERALTLCENEKIEPQDLNLPSAQQSVAEPSPSELDSYLGDKENNMI